MNRKGFTLIELLATLVILGIITGLVIVSTRYSVDKTREHTEEVFVSTINDALKIYVDSDARKLNFGSTVVCTIEKTLGEVKVYKATNNLTFQNVVNSSYKPILESELVNPANKDKNNYQCVTTGTLNIYRDEDYVYYYKIERSSFGCLNKGGLITNLPDGCNG